MVGDQTIDCGKPVLLTPSSQLSDLSHWAKMSVARSPTVTSRTAAVSRLVLAIGPLTVNKPLPGGNGPPLGIRPCEVFMPVNPHNAAGIRIEPPPSDPVASGTRPAASAAAVPPDDPPGVWARLQGLRVIPKGTLSVLPRCPNSGVFVFPTTTQPAAFNLRTSSES